MLHAPTGAGKTTRVPPALLSLGLDGDVIVLEPRRVAARAAARRMAEEAGEPLGETYGYQVRLDRVAGPRTRVLVVTEGVLLARLASDPALDGVAAVVLDEVHERSVDADVALGICRQLQEALRPELRLIAMSATADTDRLAPYLDAAVVRSEGRAFPVDVRYLPRPLTGDIEEAAADAAIALLSETEGDVLVFLPGSREIARTARALAARRADAEIAVLHGRLPPAAQDAVLRPGAGQRVVLATNVAETSVTLPGVTAVVDTGLVRQVRHDPARGLDRLLVVPTSRASAAQRAGRAGRVRAGVALRLWTEAQHGARPAHDVPEVLRADLSAAVLALRAWGEPEPAAFPWPDPPPAHALAAADDLLAALGALSADRRALSPVGVAMAALGLAPRLGRALVEGARRGALVHVAGAVVALLDAPLRREGPARVHARSDLEDQLDALTGGPDHGWKPAHPGAPRAWLTAREALVRRARRVLGEGSAPLPDTREDEDRALAAALIAGFPDRVARARDAETPADASPLATRPDSPRRLLLASGRGAMLDPASAVQTSDLVVALEVDDRDGAEARVRLASAVSADLLPVTTTVQLSYDADRDRLVGEAVTAFGALVLKRQSAPVPDEDVLAALTDAARAHPHRALPHRADPEGDAAHVLARLRFLARARPDLALPPLDDEALLARVPEAAPRARSLAEAARGDWVAALRGALTWPQQQALDTLAPSHLQVPSGSRVALQYPEEGPPVLAVRMAELFGLATTPTVAGAPVRLHLLAPNFRVQQVTDDLAGFWARTWPEVRKELRARYPKHSWPEDPLTAEPLRGARRRPAP